MKIAPHSFVLRWLLTVCLICACLPQQFALAADEASENADTGKLFANIWRIKGDVFATNLKGSSRKLKEGSSVYVGEKVRASATGEAVLKTADKGIVALRPGAEFIPERFAAEGRDSDHQVLRLLTGSLRLISGWIAQLNRQEHRVITPSATIGIRGTDHEPYVLPLDSATRAYQPGTYDKVNRGATDLDAYGGKLLIDKGRVGFARDPNSTPLQTRGLMTLLLPSLLAKVPDFYIPGAFDAELNRYSENLEAEHTKVSTNNKGKASDAAPVATTLPPKPLPLDCTPQAIGEYWLDHFDRAIINRDIKTLLGMLAPNVIANATVRMADNNTQTIHLNRDEIVQSTLSAITNLKNYQQRRISIEAKSENTSVNAKNCPLVVVKSLVIEQGLLNSQPYRFEASETYQLEQINGAWQATDVQTIQQ